MLRTLIPAALFFGCLSSATGGTYYVATTGSDYTGNGSSAAPWATLAYAVTKIPDDGSTIEVRAGVYDGRVRLNRRFVNRTYLRGDDDYRTIIRSSDSSPVITIYGGANFELRGFQITRPGPSATGVILVHIQTSGLPAEDITLRDNILHDSYNNDLLKINYGARRVQVISNLFYNQSGYDEHIDINGVTDVQVSNNIFFNDFAGSGRSVGNNTGSFIVIKNSGGLPQNARITVNRNVFLNWQGAAGASAITVGEDGTAHFEAEDVLIENNLIVGNSANTMSSAFTVQGSRRIKIRANTVTGNLPTRSYGMNVFKSGSNQPNEDVTFYNNIFSDPTGTMGKFSRGNPSTAIRRVLLNNLYWNGGAAINADGDAYNISEDTAKVIGDPVHYTQQGIVLPRLKGTRFLSGNQTIRGEFRRLAETYARLGKGSAAIGRANRAEMPEDDILGRKRGPTFDIGCWNSTTVPPATATIPRITSVRGVNNAALGPGAAAEVRGLNLADYTARPPEPATAVYGTMVLVDGIPQTITYISPGLVRFVMPEVMPSNREVRIDLAGVWSNLVPF